MSTNKPNQEKIACPSKTENCTDEVKDPNYKCRLKGLIVEFRPKQGFGGEYGFDWLRIDDKDVKQQINRGDFTDEPYKEAILTGHKSNRARLTKEKAYEKLKKEYHQLTSQDSKGLVKREGYEDSTYYVPFLNIFSKKSSEALKKEIPSLMLAPPFEAELRLIFYASCIRPDKVIFEFPEEFEVNGNKSPYIWEDDVDFVAHHKNRESSKTFTVTCLNDISEKRYIEAYAIYNEGKESKGKESESKASEGKASKEKLLAGKLCLLPNDKAHRKILKIAPISVQIKPDETSNIIEGKLTLDELKRLHSGLYQALIIPNILTKDSSGNNLELNLTQDSLWQLPNKATILMMEKYSQKKAEYEALLLQGKDQRSKILEANKKRLEQELSALSYRYDSYLEITPEQDSAGNSVYYFNNSGKIRYTDGGIDKNRYTPETLIYLKQKFTQTHQYSDELKDAFLLFIFDIYARSNPKARNGLVTVGMVNGIGERLGFLSKRRSFDTFTHELLHGLGLWHTHLHYDKENPPAKGRYIYHHGLNDGKRLATDNIMSYKHPGNITWKWQWEILHEKN